MTEAYVQHELNAKKMSQFLTATKKPSHTMCRYFCCYVAGKPDKKQKPNDLAILQSNTLSIRQRREKWLIKQITYSFLQTFETIVRCKKTAHFLFIFLIGDRLAGWLACWLHLNNNRSQKIIGYKWIMIGMPIFIFVQFVRKASHFFFVVMRLLHMACFFLHLGRKWASIFVCVSTK